jgi:nucleotide-binding universal stress UspA family protein
MKMKTVVLASGTRRMSGRPRAPAKTSDRRRGISSLKVLVIVDATEASHRALQYVGRILAHRVGMECHLAYIASRLPPELLESGGSERPEREEQIESDLRLEQHRWTAVTDKKSERVLRTARATLQRAGVAAACIHTCVSSPLDARRTADEVLLMARDQACRTVVVGHRAHTWFRGLGGGHLAEQLVRSAKGLAVWVID